MLQTCPEMLYEIFVLKKYENSSDTFEFIFLIIYSEKIVDSIALMESKHYLSRYSFCKQMSFRD
jgi:hypothetical protein